VSDEEAPRERKSVRARRGPGLASALAGAGLLMVLGFALGVVGGLVMEEPDLLLDYVLGRTEPVAVGGEAPPSAGPAADVAARPPSSVAPEAAESGAQPQAAGVELESAGPPGSAPSPAAPESLPAEPEEAAPAVAAAPPPAGGFAVQVGAFTEASAAEQLARRLREHGHPVYVAPSVGSDTARWRVRVGPLSSRAEAEGVAARLEREERLSTWVLAESPL
jgi:cell division septation protein DedD